MNGIVIGNRGGVPVVNVTPSVGAAAVTYSLPNHIFRYAGQKGIIILELAAMPSGTTTTLPIVISTNDKTLPLVDNSNAAVTVDDVNTLFYLNVVFDKQANRLVLI